MDGSLNPCIFSARHQSVPSLNIDIMNGTSYFEESSRVQSSVEVIETSRSPDSFERSSSRQYSSANHVERSGPPPPQIPPIPRFPSPLTDANDSTLPEERDNTRLSDGRTSVNIPQVDRKPIPETPSVHELEVPSDAGEEHSTVPSTAAKSETGTVKETVREDSVKPLWKVWWLELACLLLSAFLFVGKSKYLLPILKSPD